MTKKEIQTRIKFLESRARYESTKDAYETKTEIAYYKVILENGRE